MVSPVRYQVPLKVLVGGNLVPALPAFPVLPDSQFLSRFQDSHKLLKTKVESQSKHS
jgi:hypothetical protein